MSTRELPLPDYDEQPLNTLRHRIRSLTEPEIRTLVEHEQEHGNRVAVLELLNHRIDELAHGAEPSAGAESEPADVPKHQRSGSSVTPESPPGQHRPTRHGTRSSTGKGIEHKP